MEQFFWPTFGAIWVFAWILVGLWAHQIRTKKNLAVREMIHKERLAAIEKGTPLPELEDDSMTSHELALKNHRGERTLQLAGVAAGLISLFAGLGIMAAFYFMQDGPKEEWTFGLIPMCVGVGLLLLPFFKRFLD